MKLTSLAFLNFRLLRDATIRLDPASPTTILVGPNNSGKTSVAEALELFVGNRRFAVDDFSLDCRDAFEKAAATVRGRQRKSGASATGGEAAAPEPQPSVATEVDASGAAQQVPVPEDASAAVVLPSISLTLEFEYEDTPEDLVVASDLLMDLDADQRHVAVRVTLEAKDVEQTLKTFASDAPP